jgi:hypothetical protein
MARLVKQSGRLQPQSYYRAPNKSTKGATRHERRLIGVLKNQRIGRLIKVALILAGLLSFWYFGFVGGVSISGDGAEGDSRLKQKLEQTLSGWHAFKPLINPGKLSQQMMAEDPSIAGLNLSWTLVGRNLSVDVNYRQAVAKAQADKKIVGLIGQDGVYYVGQTEQDLPPIQDNEGLAPQPGQQFVPIRVLEFIRLVEQSIEHLPKDIQDSRQYQLVGAAREVWLASSRGFIVKLNIERSAADQMSELAETLKYLKSKDDQPDQYIDLRIDDTAYYQ